MRKIMLVVEDFSESNRCQMVLKKIGFDVLSMHTSTGLVEKILGFNPDVIVCYGSQKFTSLSVGQKLKDMQHLKAKSIIVLPQGERPRPADFSKIRMDILMEAPLMPEKLIEVLAKLTGLDAGLIFEKLKKAQLADPTLGTFKSLLNSNNSESSSSQKNNKINDSVRSDKYNKFVQQLQPIDNKQTTFVRSELKEHQAEMEKGWDPQLTESINELKKEFVEALFRKKGE